jgi:hypothetical protein
LLEDQNGNLASISKTLAIIDNYAAFAPVPAGPQTQDIDPCRVQSSASRELRKIAPLWIALKRTFFRQVRETRI